MQTQAWYMQTQAMADRYKLEARAGNTSWGPAPVNKNWQPAPVYTNLGPGPVNKNWAPGPGAQQSAGSREIQAPVFKK